MNFHDQHDDVDHENIYTSLKRRRCLPTFNFFKIACNEELNSYLSRHLLKFTDRRANPTMETKIGNFFFFLFLEVSSFLSLEVLLPLWRHIHISYPRLLLLSIHIYIPRGWFFNFVYNSQLTSMVTFAMIFKFINWCCDY